MDSYKKPYLHLFNSISDAAEQIRKANYGCALSILLTAQADAEALFLDAEGEESAE